jgi:HSP20 family protein
MTYVNFNKRPFDKSITTMVDELIGELPGLFNEGYASLSKQSHIPVNIKENETGYMLEVIAPAFEKNDFQIKIDDNILTISAERKNETEVNTKEKQIRKEYSFNDFKRSFTIDEKIDATKIEASYVNGVLRLNLPKKTEVKQKATEIVIN